MADPNQKAIVEELYRRRDTLDASKRAVVEELAGRLGVSGPPQPSFLDRATEFGAGAVKGLIGNTAENLYEMGKRVVMPAEDSGGRVAQLVGGPAGALVMDLAKAQVGQVAKAVDAAKQGQYLEAAGQAVAGMLPGVGPAIAHGAEKLGTAAGLGDVFGAGEAVGDLVGLAVIPEVAKRIPTKILPSPANPATAEAVAFGQKRGIPLDAATQTGSTAVQLMQKSADSTPLGAIAAQRAKTAQGEAFARVGEELKQEAYPTSIVPEQAGEGVRGAMEAEVLKYNTEAASAYDALRKIEADPANKVAVQTGIARSPEAAAELDAFSMSLANKPFAKLQPAEQKAVLDTAKSAGVQVAETPVIEEIALPVDLRGVKAQMQPIYEKLIRQMPVAQVRASTGMKAIANIMEAPDFLPLSLADADLSAIKAAARGADLPELRTLSQGLAAKAVEALEEAVQDGTARGGPAAMAARDAGRAAVAAKYDTAAVLRNLPEKEMVQVFNKLTWSNDAGVGLLREVAKQAPGEMPKMARAYLESLLSKATAEGGFSREASMLREWQNLGAETKKILFKNPMQIKDLDNFFLLAKKAAENPNPSGSAVVGGMLTSAGYMFAHPTTGVPMVIGAGALSKLLHSPKAVAALSKGLDPKFNKGLGAAATAANILKVAGDQAKPLDQEEKRR
jgi:propanediol dehydratase small subunit